jgi:hypothetical protein
MHDMNLQNTRWIVVAALLLFGAVRSSYAAEGANSVVLENAHFRYVIGTNGFNQAFFDRATGVNYSRSNTATPCAIAWKGGLSHAAISATQSDGHLHVRFDGLDTELLIKTEILPTHIVFRVEAVKGEQPDKVAFINLALNLQGRPDEPFGGCVLALNLQTRVDALPALQRDLCAIAEAGHGLVGTRAALVAAPMRQMLPALQAALSTSSELPVCKVAGPWAREEPFSRGSYLFNFGSLSATNLDEWISTVHNLGFTQIDNHGGGSFFRFGDFKLDAQRWPDGWATWEKEILPRLKKAGIGSIFHTYAFFIDKRSKYVTPVPDSRLDAFRTFTLARPLAADATEIVVNESTADLSLITGFFEQNSVTLQLGDELVTFGGFSKQAPWTFSIVTRGAHGTPAVAHPEGVRVRHLKELFGLFVPDVDSNLFAEIAANHAEVVNQCGFEGIYLDAIDGAGILRGPDQAWYWGAKFVVEIQKRLKRPVGMEMSAMWHHFWQYRTRWQAWDYPVRGHLRFIDLHAQSINGGLLLPLHLGWWSFSSFDPPQVEPTYPNVMETLGARLIGWDAGISLTAAVGREALATTPLYRRDVEILRACEELRHSGTYGEAAKFQLRQPGSEFALFKNAAGLTRFRKAQSHSHTAAVAEASTLGWRITNALPAQPVRFRIEALLSASATSTSAVVLADFAGASNQEWKRSSAAGVSFELTTNGALALLTATNQGRVPRPGAWSRLEREFNPPLDLRHHQALAVEVEGDGSGALLAIRLESPHHLSFGAVADRYIVLDFTGRRTFSLVETESVRWSDYAWDDAKSAYNVYRETIKFEAVNKVSVWLQNLPAQRETRVAFSPIRAVPVQRVSIKNPTITLGGQRLTLKAEIPAGGWVEGNGPKDCAIYGPKGEMLGTATISDGWPDVPQGPVDMGFNCDLSGQLPRARVVLFLAGEEI